jgi:hypothetical protein
LASAICAQAAQQNFDTFTADFGTQAKIDVQTIPIPRIKDTGESGGILTTYIANYDYGFFQVTVYNLAIDAKKTISERVALSMSRMPAMKKGTVTYSTFVGYESDDISWTDTIDGVAHDVTERFIVVNPRIQYVLLTAIDARYPQPIMSQMRDEFLKSFALYVK